VQAGPDGYLLAARERGVEISASRTEIESEDIYFIHVKSPTRGALSLAVTHRWPAGRPAGYP
jgi:hypothetical protein